MTMLKMRVLGLSLFCLAAVTAGVGCSTCDPYSAAPLHDELHDLAPGESADALVRAGKCWNPTQVRLEAGSTYLLEVKGNQHWRDGIVQTGPGGFWALLLQWEEPSRRVPEANWMSFVGTINGWQDAPFVIGRRCVYTPLLSGELVCYANETSLGYADNGGSVTLTIERLTSTKNAPPGTLPTMPAETRPLSRASGPAAIRRATTPSTANPTAAARDILATGGKNIEG